MAGLMALSMVVMMVEMRAVMMGGIRVATMAEMKVA
jgi:hypothetical protein